MRAKAFTIRVRVSGVLVQVGFSCVVLTMTCFLNIGKWFKIAPPNGGHMPLVGCALPIGLALMLLGLFPIDATAIRVVCAMIFSLIAFIILFMGSFLLLDPHAGQPFAEAAALAHAAGAAQLACHRVACGGDADEQMSNLLTTISSC